METITNIFSGIFSGADNFVSATIDNKYFFITIVVITILYGSLNQSRLVSNIMACFDNPISRIGMIGFIYYISTKNVPLAILMLTATVVSMNTQSKQRLNYVLISMFRSNYLRDQIRRRSRKLKKRSSKRRSSKRKSSKRRSSKRKTSKRKLSKKDKLLLKLRKRKLGDLINLLNKLIKKAKEKRLKKVPSKLAKVALKAKQIATAIKVQTPKVVQKIAEKIKEAAKKVGKDTPKIVAKISTTVGNIKTNVSKVVSKVVKNMSETSTLVPTNVINKLVDQKKISKEDAEKLKNLKTASILNILKSNEAPKVNTQSAKELIKKVEVKTEISTLSPQSSDISQSSTRLVTPKTPTLSESLTGSNSTLLDNLPKTQIIFPEQKNVKSERFSTLFPF